MVVIGREKQVEVKVVGHEMSQPIFQGWNSLGLASVTIHSQHLASAAFAHCCDLWLPWHYLVLQALLVLLVLLVLLNPMLLLQCLFLPFSPLYTGNLPCNVLDSLHCFPLVLLTPVHAMLPWWSWLVEKLTRMNFSKTRLPGAASHLPVPALGQWGTNVRRQQWLEVHVLGVSTCLLFLMGGMGG